MTNRIELTDEMRVKLAGHLPFSLEATIKYPPSEYIDKYEKDGKKVYVVDESLHNFFPVFELRGFTEAEKIKSESITKEMRADKENLKLDEQIKEIKELVRLAVKGWTHFIDIGTKKEIIYETDAVSGCKKEVFEKVPMGMIWKLYYYVQQLSCITSGEKISLA
jgi:hypothetical protein